MTMQPDGGIVTIADFGIPLEMLPEDIREAFTYLVQRGEMIDSGVPVGQLPSYDEWKAADHG